MLTYLWSQGMVDTIAKKVAEEPTDFQIAEQILDNVPQHVIDEERGDMIRMLRKEQAQREMYDDPYENWSGHR